MARRVYVIGHRNPDVDSICSAIAYAHLKNRLGEHHVRPARAGELDDETVYVLDRFDVPAPELLVDATGLRLILVDHNEIAQALDHVEHANILEIWEHHRMGDLHLSKPIVFHCEPVGATATLIAEQYVMHGMRPSRAMAGIMLAAIVADTVLLRSPTTSHKDRRIVSRLASSAGVDPLELGQHILEVKTASTERKSPHDLVHGDLKQFVLGGQPIAMAQVEIVHPEVVRAHKAEILREMHALRERDGVVQVILIVTNIETGSSELWFVGDRRELFEEAFGTLEDDAVVVPGLMSRKQQVVPALDAVFARASTELYPPATRATPATAERSDESLRVAH